MSRSLESKANLKKFSWFRIEAGPIEEVNKLPCAKADVWLSFSFNMVSNDGAQEETSVYGSGQCNWGTNESFDATSDTFTYERKNSLNGPNLQTGIQSRSAQDSLSLALVTI